MSSILNANKLLQEGIEQVISAGIKPGIINPNVKINTRAINRFGQCRKLPQSQYDYEIQINSKLLEVSKDKAMNTLVHEILHTCKGCMNHGKTWKHYANVMNIMFGYDISRTSSYETIGIDKPEYKYMIKCDKCSVSIGRQKQSKLVTHTHQYRCKCGGNLHLV
ncbi:MAG TPA: sprT domain-containing protein [Clostridiales bacterium]|nr:sprT domain-containing protein [Clostridiales bacterium]